MYFNVIYTNNNFPLQLERFTFLISIVVITKKIKIYIHGHSSGYSKVYISKIN